MSLFSDKQTNVSYNIRQRRETSDHCFERASCSSGLQHVQYHELGDDLCVLGKIEHTNQFQCPQTGHDTLNPSTRFQPQLFNATLNIADLTVLTEGGNPPPSCAQLISAQVVQLSRWGNEGHPKDRSNDETVARSIGMR